MSASFGSSRPERKIIKRAAENAEARLFDWASDSERFPTESPIERLLLLALLAEIEFGSHEHDGWSFLAPSGLVTHSRPDTAGLVLGIQCQAQLGDYRVDFLVATRAAPSDPMSTLVVECDGHNFHERTKEQAQRDRERDRVLQAQGHTVFRFTGSEIWRDPCKCADTILEWAVEKAFPR